MREDSGIPGILGWDCSLWTPLGSETYSMKPIGTTETQTGQRALSTVGRSQAECKGVIFLKAYTLMPSSLAIKILKLKVFNL